jgi:hypothetical protein
VELPTLKVAHLGEPTISRRRASERLNIDDETRTQIPLLAAKSRNKAVSP